MQQRIDRDVRELPEIAIKTDLQAEAFEDYFVARIAAHVTETQFWPEIIELIDKDVIRQMSQAMAARPGGYEFDIGTGRHQGNAGLWLLPAKDRDRRWRSGRDLAGRHASTDHCDSHAR